jgi:hypothetical protein
MATHYHYHVADMSTFDAWRKKNQALLERCTFDQSWRWSDGTYIDTFRVHLSDEPIHHDYDLRNHASFISRYETQKAIGHWQGALFRRIGDLVRDADFSTSSLMGIENDCYVYTKYCSREEMRQIKELIEEKIGLQVRLHQVAKGEWQAWLHSDPLVLQALTLADPPAPAKGKDKPARKVNPAIAAEDWLAEVALKMGVSREEAMQKMQELATNHKPKKSVTKPRNK